MTAAMTAPEIERALKQIDGWTHQHDSLFREIEFNDFKEALSFIVYVGMVAESANHHPQIQNVYNRVRLALSTHEAGNKVTKKDVDLARSINAMLE